MTRVAYTAGPYRSPDGGINGVHDNIEAARQVAVELWKIGFACICPHMNTAMMDGACGPDDSGTWISGDLEILKRCDLVVMLPGWRQSAGAVREWEQALKCGITVVHWPQDMAELVALADA